MKINYFISFSVAHKRLCISTQDKCKFKGLIMCNGKHKTILFSHIWPRGNDNQTIAYYRIQTSVTHTDQPLCQLRSLLLNLYIHLQEYSLISVMDECSMIPDLCKPNGKCIDTRDSYRCMCHHGYQLSRNGKSCVGEPLIIVQHIWHSSSWILRHAIRSRALMLRIP
jgi:hypothetical protein